MATLLAGVFLGATINNLAAAPLSLIAEDFDTTPSRITLVASASGFALACCMPLSGWLSVRWGSRRVLMGAYGLLGVGCLMAGLASSVWLLVVARIVQGLAMSVVPPTVMHVLPEVMGLAKRERALGWWAVANGAGTAAGAPLGALIADTLGWRAMFLVFVPGCAVLMVACWWMKPDAAPQRRLDVGSALLLTLALAFLIAPVMVLGAEIPTGALIAAFVVGIGAVAVFLRGLHRSAAPFVSPALLRSPGFFVGSLGGTSQMFILGSVSVLVPLVALQTYGMSLRLAGLLVLVVTLMMMGSAPPISRLVPRFGTPRVIAVGLVLSGTALVGTGGALAVEAPVLLLVACLLVLGAGLGLLQSPSAIAVSSEPASRGAGIGLFNSIRFGGGVVGISWLSLMSLFGVGTDQALLLAAFPVLTAAVAIVLHRPRQ